MTVKSQVLNTYFLLVVIIQLIPVTKHAYKILSALTFPLERKAQRLESVYSLDQGALNQHKIQVLIFGKLLRH